MGCGFPFRLRRKYFVLLSRRDKNSFAHLESSTNTANTVNGTLYSFVWSLSPVDQDGENTKVACRCIVYKQVAVVMALADNCCSFVGSGQVPTKRHSSTILSTFRLLVHLSYSSKSVLI